MNNNIHCEICGKPKQYRSGGFVYCSELTDKKVRFLLEIKATPDKTVFYLCKDCLIKYTNYPNSDTIFLCG